MIDEQEKINKKQENKKTEINCKTYSKNRNNDNNGTDSPIANSDNDKNKVK